MHTQHWLDPKFPDRTYGDRVSEYKANRLFIFLDGPLALHSVPFDTPDHTPDPARARDGGRHARRRILRSHVKIHHDPFYRKHSRMLPQPIDPVSFMRLMAPNPVLSAEDRRYCDTVLRPFFKERIDAYARAATRIRGTISHAPPPRLWDRITGRTSSANERFMSQLVARIP